MEEQQVNATSTCEPFAANHSLTQPQWRCVPKQADQAALNWSTILFGIVLAGAAYPIVLTLFLIGWVLLADVFYGSSESDPRMVFLTLGKLIAFMFIGAAAGAAWAAFVGMFILPCVYLVTRTLRVTRNLMTLGAFAGGLVGFVATWPAVLFADYWSFPDDAWYSLLTLARGPGLTTILGQLGGAWGASRCLPVVDNRQTFTNGGTALDAYVSDDVAGRSGRSDKLAFRFNLRQLLWIAFWLSLLMGLIRLTGVPFEVAIPLLVGWTVYQFATLATGAYLVRRLGPWWAARQRSRST